MFLALEGVMVDFLETCKIRMAESQKRFLEAQQKLQMAQQAFAMAQQEFAAWQQAVAFETKRQQQQSQPALVPPAAVVSPATPTLTTTAPVAIAPAAPVADALPVAPSSKIGSPPNANTSEENKTELIREVLAQHPTGMNPTEIWEIVKDRIARPYVYSVLKRLRDGHEVMYQKKRKKYTLRITDNQEGIKEHTVVQ